MEQQIRFCSTRDGIRIAYATVGQGSALVWPPGWISHLELEWQEPAVRGFIEALARHHTVVRYDKYGCGLSDRDRTDFSPELELQALDAVVEHLRLKRFGLFAVSQGGPIAIAYAVGHPRRVSHLMLYGTYAHRGAIQADPLRESLQSLVRAHWGLGSKTLAEFYLPGAGPVELEWFARMQREAASAETAAEMVGLSHRLNATDLAPRVRVPTLVIHRRGDLAVPLHYGRELAALIPGARFVPLEGEIHRPYFGDAESVLRAMLDFLGDPAAPAPGPGRAVATVLFTDIVGSTERAAALGDRLWRELLESHHAAVRRELVRFGGREIDTAGDGFLATFESPAQAVRCACAIRDAVRPLGIAIRAGLHSGECEPVGDKVGGIAVHTGARVAAQAAPGEVLVSGTVRELVAGSDLRFEDRGVHALKGIPGEWRLFAVAESLAL